MGLAFGLLHIRSRRKRRRSLKKRKEMKRTIAAIATLTASITCLSPVAHADHDVSRSIRREYDLHRKDLDRSYRAEIQAVRCEYQRHRDLLLAERERVIHSHCANRGDEIRAISRQLSFLSREYGRNLRNLASVFADHREELRNRRDLALRRGKIREIGGGFRATCRLSRTMLLPRSRLPPLPRSRCRCGLSTTRWI